MKTVFTSKSLAKKIASFCDDKKAEDIVILDMRKVVNFCDYFVIASGTTDRHVRAIAQGIDDGLLELNKKIRFKQGLSDGKWVVFDSGDVVAHIFQKDARGFYDLEHLWQDAKIIKK